MMRASVRFAIACWLMLLLLPQAARAQEESWELEALLDQVAQADQEELWIHAARLEELGEEALPGLLEGLNRSNPNVRMACAMACYALEHRLEAVSALIGLMEETETEQRARAAELLFTLIKGDSDYGDQQQLADEIDNILDKTFDKPTRIPLCKLLFELTSDIYASKILTEILEGPNEDLRVEAAFALAEMDYFDAAEPLLLRLSLEPTLRGELARSYLRRKKLLDDYELGLLPSPKPQYALLDDIIDRILRRYVDPDELDRDELIEAAAKGIAGSLDPFSAYLNEKELKELVEGINLDYGGIGAHVSMRDRVLTIERPVYSGPAYRAGLRSLDRIVEVKSGGTYDSTYGKDITQVVNQLKGEPGTDVTFKVMRRGWTEPREYTLTRAQIHINTAKGELLPGGIGYVVLTSFGKDTADELDEVLRRMRDEDMKALVVDVRNNSGGYLESALDVVDCFLEDNLRVVTVKERHGKIRETLRTKNEDRVDVPIIVLMNEGTASASEILSGALQDHQRAVLVGENSYGKGSVQQIMQMKSTRYRTALRLTTAYYYLPLGRCIHKGEDEEEGGLSPDVLIEAPERDLWKEFEFNRILDSAELSTYLEKFVTEDAALAAQLAEDDSLDPTLYPGLAALYASLETKLELGEFREIVREQLRRKVADQRSREFLTDLQSDIQLQRGLVETCQRAGIDPASIPAFQPFAHKFDEQAGSGESSETTD